MLDNNLRLEKYLTHLPEQERKNISQLTAKNIRDNQWISRSLLRQLLSPILSLPPQHIEFETTANNKPILARKYARNDIHFNVSHCQDAILIGLHSKPIGVDLEKSTRTCSHLKLAKKHFTAEEYQSCQRYDTLDHFLKLWTLKEAYAKATGLGIYASFKSFTVVDPHTHHPSIKNKQHMITLQSLRMHNYLLGIAVQQPEAKPLSVLQHHLK